LCETQGFASRLTLTRTAGGSLQMSAFSLNGMVSFVGGQWEVIGSFNAFDANLVTATLCLKGSMWGYI
jgi:hypothetical protein